MQGDAKVIDELNARLAEELTAINQYFVHAEMCEDWHYDRLAEPIKKRSIDEMKHAEKLIERILFLDGRPIVSELNKIHIGAAVPQMHSNDLAGELDAVKSYNDSIRICVKLKDDGTKELLEVDPRRRGGPRRLARGPAHPDRAGRPRELLGRADRVGLPGGSRGAAGGGGQPALSRSHAPALTLRLVGIRRRQRSRAHVARVRSPLPSAHAS